MDLFSVKLYLRWQRLVLSIFRIAQGLFTFGLEMFLVFSRILWLIPLLLAFHFRNAIVCWLIDGCMFFYNFILYKKVIEPRMTGWLVGRCIICEDFLVKKVVRTMAHCRAKNPSLDPVRFLESPELGLKKDEIRLMKTTLQSKDLIQEVFAN